MGVWTQASGGLVPRPYAFLKTQFILQSVLTVVTGQQAKLWRSEKKQKENREWNISLEVLKLPWEVLPDKSTKTSVDSLPQNAHETPTGR